MNTKVSYRSRCALFLLIMLMMACVTQLAYSSQLSKLSSGLQSVAIPEEAQLQEMITINGETHIIPPPWTGNRLVAQELEYSDFCRISAKYTHNGSKIYILAAAYQPLVDLLQAAEKDGIFLKVESAYRSVRYQKRIYKRMLAEGRTFDDIVRYVAPPGYSQHMLGTAVDFFPSNWRFAEKIAYTWLRKNGGRFGFEETYSQSNPMKMPWEAWHWNFIGKMPGDQTDSDLLSSKAKKSEANFQE